MSNYVDSDEDIHKNDVRYGRRAVANQHAVKNGDIDLGKGCQPSRPERFDSDSDFSSRESSASSSAGRTRRRLVVFCQFYVDLLVNNYLFA